MPKTAMDIVIDEYIHMKEQSEMGEIYKGLHAGNPRNGTQIEQAMKHVNGLSNTDLIEFLDKAGLLVRKDD
nr:hypothetical protein [Brucella intermedia]